VRGWKAGLFGLLEKVDHKQAEKQKEERKKQKDERGEGEGEGGEEGEFQEDDGAQEAGPRRGTRCEGCGGDSGAHGGA
jgi:hypothetical protein